jgi:hypothetical protein
MELVSERMSYINLNGRWCNNISLNVYAPNEDKVDDMKYRFYKDLNRYLISAQYTR